MPKEKKTGKIINTPVTVSKATAKEAYDEFQKQAEAIKSKAADVVKSNPVNYKMSVYPPQTKITSPAYHHGGHAMPPQPYHHQAPAAIAPHGHLLDKVKNMVTLGVDFVTSGLSMGLTLMDGNTPHSGHHNGHTQDHQCGCHVGHPQKVSDCGCNSGYTHDDCNCQSTCSCNDNPHYTLDTCGCNPSVNGCC